MLCCARKPGDATEIKALLREAMPPSRPEHEPDFFYSEVLLLPSQEPVLGNSTMVGAKRMRHLQGGIPKSLLELRSSGVQGKFSFGFRGVGRKDFEISCEVSGCNERLWNNMRLSRARSVPALSSGGPLLCRETFGRTPSALPLLPQT